MAQSVERLTSAQVMMSWFLSSNPKSGSVLTAQSLEPVSASPTHALSLSQKQLKTNVIKNLKSRGACVAQSVRRPTLAQVMISLFVGLSPHWGSVLTAHSLEPASDSVSPLSAPPPLVLCLSQKYIYKCKKNLKK